MRSGTASTTIHLGSAVLPRLGRVEVAATASGVCAIALPQWNDHDLRLGPWEEAGFRAERTPDAVVRQALSELRAYADGSSTTFDVALALRHLPAFTTRVLRALLAVPAGEVTTYGRLAAKAGSPGASRAVGGAVGRNPIPIIVPCHRVVASDGIGGFGLGLACKRTLLAIEGVVM
jgi:methylated-DNA-[protein]-cysteine S-methyltransferase